MSIKDHQMKMQKLATYDKDKQDMAKTAGLKVLSLVNDVYQITKQYVSNSQPH